MDSGMMSRYEHGQGRVLLEDLTSYGKPHAHIDLVVAMPGAVHGDATAALEAACQDADRLGVELTLEVAPLRVRARRTSMNFPQLIRWYRRFGFRATHRPGTRPGFMVRRPHQQAMQLSAVELSAAWQDEPRDSHGRWARLGGGTALLDRVEHDRALAADAHLASPEDFSARFEQAFRGSPYTAFVNHYSPAEIRAGHMTPVLAAGGKAGLLIHNHGDGRIEPTALFNVSGQRGMGLALLRMAREKYRANYIECFGPALNTMYATLGFTDRDVYPFDPAEAPAGWDYARFDNPDYHVMAIPAEITTANDDDGLDLERIWVLASRHPSFSEDAWQAALAVFGIEPPGGSPELSGIAAQILDLAHFHPDQPRWPKGTPRGGEWRDKGGAVPQVPAARWHFDPQDNPQQRRTLRRHRVSQIVRGKYPAGTRVKARASGELGTVERHIPQPNAQGGYLLIKWDRTGTTGRHGPIAIERADQPQAPQVSATGDAMLQQMHDAAMAVASAIAAERSDAPVTGIADPLARAEAATMAWRFTEARRQMKIAIRVARNEGYAADLVPRLERLDQQIDGARHGIMPEPEQVPVDAAELYRRIRGEAAAAVDMNLPPEQAATLASAARAMERGTVDGFAQAARYMNGAANTASAAGDKHRAARYLAFEHALLQIREDQPLLHTPRAAVSDLLDQHAGDVAGLLGGGHQMYSGKLRIASPLWDEFIAELNWDADMSVQEWVADQVADAAGEPRKPQMGDPSRLEPGYVTKPEALQVLLHELIHGVIAESEPHYYGGLDKVTRRLYSHKQAYQDPRTAYAEEGFTELGATLHAADWFDAIGVGDRQTLGLSGYTTMREHARELATPDEITRGEYGPWGHYPEQTKWAYQWCTLIAQAGGSQGQDMPRIRELSDEVNRQGVAGKFAVMADQLVRVSGGWPEWADERQTALSTSRVQAAIAEHWGGQGGGTNAYIEALAAYQKELRRLEFEQYMREPSGDYAAFT
jgi:hypothetical protein